MAKHHLNEHKSLKAAVRERRGKNGSSGHLSSSSRPFASSSAKRS
jgi:hypothetical protein